MVATTARMIGRSLLTFRSSCSYLMSTRFSSSSSIARAPPLPGFSPTVRSTVSLSHSLRVFAPAAVRLNLIRCRVNRSGGAYSPLNSGSNFSDRPPTETPPLFPGCDYEPGGKGATKQQMIDCYVETLAKVLGSEEEAKKKIYNVSCERDFGFGCEIDEETSNKLEGLLGVLFEPSDRHLHTLYPSVFSSSSSIARAPPLPGFSRPVPSTASLLRYFSTNRGNNNENGGKPSDFWKILSENDENMESLFGEDTETLEGIAGSEDKVRNPTEELRSWFSSESKEKGGNDEESDIFRVSDSEPNGTEVSGGGSKNWNFTMGDQKDGEGDDEIFDIGDAAGASELAGIDEDSKVDSQKKEDRLLEIEEKALSEVLEGPNQAFGDLIAASGITDEMLDSLMALKDLDDVPGLPPLSEIEDMRYEKNTRKSTRADIERQKQEEIAKSRVRQVDSQGRAYGTGKRKCSIARVWIEPGEGKFVINDKHFDVYFPMLDQRAALLRPLSETKTLGLLDVNCTVKGGGVSGQIGAIRLGMSRALQNWAPDQFRPPLKEAGFLTRDSRIVERKKPGKAKARKSFQWVKR